MEIVPAPPIVTSLEGWAMSERGRVELVRSAAAECPKLLKTGPAVRCQDQEVRFDLAPGLFYRRCSIYFIIRVKLFKAVLLYNEADPTATDKVNLFRKYLDTLEPLR